MRKHLKGKLEKGILLLISSILAVSFRVVYVTTHSPHLLSSNNVLQVHLDQFPHHFQVNTTKQSKVHNVLIPPLYPDSVDPFYTIPSDGTNMWDQPAINQLLPDWMKAYFNWHKHKRRTVMKDNVTKWKREQWLVMQCLAGQDPGRCGGTADRLKPLPFLLRLAYENHRILLIHWTRPAPLETFLVPPQGGFDWRATDALAEILKDNTNGLKFMIGKEIRQYAAFSNLTLLRTRLQTDKAGQNDYDSMIRYQRDDGRTFDHVFAPLWRVFFRPSKAVEKKIETFLTANQLIPGNYVACHLRALYGIESRPDLDVLRLTEHAVNCSTQLRPAHPIYFASDSSAAAKMAKKYVGDMGGRLVVNDGNFDPPHLDLDRHWKIRDPTYYFGTFVDLYLIALAGCVTFSEGGFGHWGLLIGGNLACQINSKTRPRGRFINECQWQGGAAVRGPISFTSGDEKDARPLFAEPMP